MEQAAANLGAARVDGLPPDHAAADPAGAVRRVHAGADLELHGAGHAADVRLLHDHAGAGVPADHRCRRQPAAVRAGGRDAGGVGAAVRRRARCCSAAGSTPPRPRRRSPTTARRLARLRRRRLAASPFVVVFLLAVLPHVSVVLTSLTRDRRLVQVGPARTAHARPLPRRPGGRPGAAERLELDPLRLAGHAAGGGGRAGGGRGDRPQQRAAARGCIDALAMLPLAVPGIVLAFGYLSISIWLKQKFPDLIRPARGDALPGRAGIAGGAAGDRLRRPAAAVRGALGGGRPAADAARPGTGRAQPRGAGGDGAARGSPCR